MLVSCLWMATYNHSFQQILVTWRLITVNGHWHQGQSWLSCCFVFWFIPGNYEVPVLCWKALSPIHQEPKGQWLGYGSWLSGALWFNWYTSCPGVEDLEVRRHPTAWRDCGTPDLPQHVRGMVKHQFSWGQHDFRTYPRAQVFLELSTDDGCISST